MTKKVRADLVDLDGCAYGYGIIRRDVFGNDRELAKSKSLPSLYKHAARLEREGRITTDERADVKVDINDWMRLL